MPAGKTCTKCGQHKLLTDFHRYSVSSDGRKPLCKKCNVSSAKLYVGRNREQVAAYQLRYRRNNKLRLKEYGRRKYTENREQILAKVKNYQKSNRHKLLARNTEYRNKNRERVRKYHRDWQRNKRQTDTLFKLISSLRHRTKSALKAKGIRKTNTTRELLGAPLEVVKSHLSALFSKGMCWDNHGLWHIDHIIPLSSATTVEDVMRLFHYKNLQPLWATDNLSKGAKV